MPASRSHLFPATPAAKSGLSSAARSSTALATAARSSQLLHRVESDFESQLAYNSCPTLFYGVGVLVVGLGLLAFGLMNIGKLNFFGENALLLDITGGALTFVGIALILLRMGLTVDRKLRRVVKWRWFGIRKSEGVHNLTAFDYLTIGQAGLGAKAKFEICLSDANENFKVATFPTENEAHDFANEVGRFLNVRVVDSVSGEWEAVR